MRAWPALCCATMVKAVFMAKRTSIYDDLIEERYHFPSRYLRAAQVSVGDWILYYEPRRTTSDDTSRGGLESYFATARVLRVVADAAKADHYYAYVADFIEFDRPVPFRSEGTYRERALRTDDGRTNQGTARLSVRSIGDDEYQDIVAAGFSALLASDSAGVSEGDRWEWASVHGEQNRPRVARIEERWFRDRAFTARVRQAYSHRCALTGLEIRNGGGRPEVQAAHIQPVAMRGPDSTRNGIAMSGTIHWMFDRGLMSLEDDGRILLAKRGVSIEIKRMLRPDLLASFPQGATVRPHTQFLRFHRETIFKA